MRLREEVERNQGNRRLVGVDVSFATGCRLARHQAGLMARLELETQVDSLTKRIGVSVALPLTPATATLLSHSPPSRTTWPPY